MNACKENGEVSQFLQKVYITSYILEDKLEFGNPDSIGKRPLLVKDKFQSQFVLNNG